MASAIQKITLSASRDISFNKLLLSACNVRRINRMRKNLLPGSVPI